jgi:predicted TIM-barrel fold metal-dependent hydrolase
MLATGAYSAVTWHNRFHGVPADAPIMFELVAVAARHEVPIFIHAAGNLDHEEGWRVARLVRRSPGARFVILDGLMTLASTEVLTDLLAETPDVWLDTANALPVRRVVEQVGEKVGWDRIVFGSCYYAKAYSFAICSPLEEFLVSGVGADAKALVLRTNIQAVVGGEARRAVMSGAAEGT